MRSLLDFPGVPPAGHINLCELEGRIHSMAADHAQVDAFTTAVSKHPHVTITRELLHRSASREDNRAVFIREPESTLKKLIRVWYEKGIFEALQLAAHGPEDGDRPAPIMVRLLSAYILKLASGLSRISDMIVAKPKASGAQLVGTVCQTRGWQLSAIRALAWHPHCTKIAVAAWDDSVRVYASSNTLTPVLKYKKQRCVSCLAWRPMSGSELAVGCEAGVFIWQVDPMSHMARPSVGTATILERPGHSPVTSITWSPQGDILLTASAADTTMYAWDVATEQYEALKRVAGWGTCFVSWSPDGARVFSATTGIIFRVWDTSSWQPERWTVISGHVQTACWSPCGSVLLFATSEEALIYSLTFKFGLTQEEYSREVAVPVFDVSEVELDTGERIGGNVVSMMWDKKGQYLALLFKTTDIIAVFFTDLYMTLQVSPCCLINGMSREIPNVIAFQQNPEEGAVLTIGWSSGRVQHFPFIRGNYKEQVSIIDDPISPILPLSVDSALDDSVWSPVYGTI